ncbi:transglutaminase domain-containing protein [Methanobrevibacter sp.]|uniref:transglutaminase domain-containing protein n=1 Tax=Methanobrevibacter sp. TaxID=66852 RepID=UPI0038902FFE
MFFVALSAASATEIIDASNTEDSNLTNDNEFSLSQEELEVSSEDSISETNIVISHDDNLKDYPEGLLAASGESYYEDNEILSLSNAELNNTISVSNDDEVLNSYVDNDVLTAKKVKTTATSLSVVDTHYNKAGTTFKVTLKDSTGKTLSNQKISLKVNSKTYSGVTNSKGIAQIKTAALAVGSYTLALTYAGSENYSSASLSKKVKVLSSVSGKDVTKYYGSSTYYSATFWKDNDALANTKVTFYIDGKKYTYTTNKNGVAQAKVELKPGKHTVSATNPVSGEKISNKIVVNKDKTSFAKKSKIYILPYNYYTYIVSLTTAHGAPVKNAKVYFSYDGRNVTATTDKNGKARTVIPLLAKGTYEISYKYKGSTGLYSSSSSGSICIKEASNKLVASDLKMDYNSKSAFSVKLTDNNNKALSGKTIKFILDGKTYTAKTDSKGIAKLTIGDLKPGTYKIKYLYSTLGASDYNYEYKNVVIKKLSAKLTANDLNMKHNDGSVYKATLKDASGKAIKNVAIKFTVNGKTYSQKTDSNGVAKLKITLPVGYYPIKSAVSSAYYSASAVSKHVFVDGYKFSASDLYVLSGKTVYYSVKLVDGKSKAVKNAAVKFTLNGKTYTKTTASDGVAKIKVGTLTSGTKSIKYAYGSEASGTSKIHVLSKVSLKAAISASNNVKKYIESNHKLPSSIKIGKYTFSTADYLYLASKAIVNLKANNKGDVPVKFISKPSSPGAAANKGNLNDYLSVAKSVIKTADSKGKMPNSVSSKVGTIGYKGLVYAFARVVAFYGDENIMPAYVTIKTLTSSSSSTSKLNSKNTIKDLTAYLAASTHCQVNDAKIKQLVTKLTKGLTTDEAKAKAIFNYVRDTISYSFYYNTRYGAVGTLNAKTGNCVDHSHLLVAMFRNAKLPARYAHGTCTFSSGTYGHVWTQVLIGDTWTVCDATSPRNSFGNVVNWNANSYSLKGYFSSIAF